MTEPLTPDQRRAAALLAAGRAQKAVAKELSVSPKSIQRWNERDDFRDLVRAQREGLVPDAPTAEAVLVSALSATDRAGNPDWNARISAARVLLSAPVSDESRDEARKRVERIYVAPNGEPVEPPPGAYGEVRPSAVTRPEVAGAD